MFVLFIGSICVLQINVVGGKSYNVDSMLNAFIPIFNSWKKLNFKDFKMQSDV